VWHGLPQEVRREPEHNPDLCASFGIFAGRPSRLVFSLQLAQPSSQIYGSSSDSVPVAGGLTLRHPPHTQQSPLPGEDNFAPLT